MTNFNEKINCGTGHVLSDRDYFIYRSDSTRIFERLIDSDLLFRKNSYRLCIQYKDTHPVESIAGHCFRWECASNTMGGYDVRNLCLDSDGNEDLDNFGDPVFDSIEGAIFITDKYVVTYGDAQIEASAISLDKKHVYCDVSLCGSIVSNFRIPAEVFDHFFGLKENFPDQYEKVFGKTEEAKYVQEETPQKEKIYAAYEIACLMDSNRLCSDFLSSLLRLNIVINARHCSDDIYDKSQAARNAVEDLAIELGISLCKIEDGLQ